MSYAHFFRSAATLEYRRALEYYSFNAPHKLEDLIAAAAETVGRITDAPTRFRERDLDIRCEFVHGFHIRSGTSGTNPSRLSR